MRKMIKSEFCIENKEEAKRFGEAYPVGNGQLGAMIYGGAPDGKIVLTENTFFSGCKTEDNIRPGAVSAFQKMRRAASENDFAKAHQFAEDFIGIRHNYGTSLPVGELRITYEETVLISRQLDIHTGIASRELQTKSGSQGGASIREECFASHPDHAFFLNMETNGRPVDIRIGFQNYSGYGSTILNNKAIDFVTGAFEVIHCDELCGVLLWGKVICLTDGTQIQQEKTETEKVKIEKNIVSDELWISKATRMTLIVLMETDFPETVTAPELEKLIQDGKTASHHLQEQAEKFALADYQVIKSRHCEENIKQMERVMINLDQDLRSAFLYQYGRYLLLSSSREDSALPAHLQGIWNDNVACRIGWTCDMHLDINTQMNYWIAETCSLQECLPPLFHWIKESLVPEGRKTAQKAYGLPGWVGEIVSNAWGYAAPYWASPIAPCPTGGIWILTHVWEHYLFTRDQVFLKDQVLPLIREAAAFFQNYIFEENDILISGPSISPENSFQKEDGIYQISNGCTYEILMIRELFQIYVNACEELEDVPETDKINCEKIKKQLKKLLPYRIMEDGTIAEYAHDFPVPDKQHRHTSHLLGLYPFCQIDPEETPLLAEAAEKTIRGKTTPETGWEDTGWARSMLLLYEARLRDPEKAWYHLQSMQNNLLEPNGMIFHPPTRGAGAFDHVYELDGNTGLTAGITEMLLQSQNNKILLLPALPKEWKTGSVTGLCARGGLRVDLFWKDGQLSKAELCSEKGGHYKIQYGRKEKEIELPAGEKQSILF